MNILKTTLTAILLFGATIYAFSQDLKKKKVGNKFGYENAKGKMVIKPVYDYAYEFDEGWAKVNLGATDSGIEGLILDGAWGVINDSGKIIVPIEYEIVNYYAFDEIFRAMKGNKAYYYNKRGKLVKVMEHPELIE